MREEPYLHYKTIHIKWHIRLDSIALSSFSFLKRYVYVKIEKYNYVYFCIFGFPN